MAATDVDALSNLGSNESSNKQLQQYIQLAQSKEGDELIEIINKMIVHPQIYVFSEVLELDSVKRLAENPELSSWYTLLELFAYGKFNDYNSAVMPPLNDKMIKKLQHLTIITLALESKKIPYSKLLNELQITELRQLEDLIIDAIYANLIKGKLDQKQACLEIDSTMSRDIRDENVNQIVDILSGWLSNCDNVLSSIEQQIHTANSIKADHIKFRTDLENYITSSKKMWKTTTTSSMPELEESWDATGVSALSSPGVKDNLVVTSHLDKIRVRKNRATMPGSAGPSRILPK